MSLKAYSSNTLKGTEAAPYGLLKSLLLGTQQ